jgi:predicted nuclease of predicted toxin-antitoxin system
MKLLFDQNISFRIVSKLEKHYPECRHVSDVGLNDAEDHIIWNFAKENDFSIVTFDSDYFDISIIKGHPPKIIWIRTGNLTTKEITELLIYNLDSIHSFLSDPNLEEMACKELEYRRS